MRRILLGVLIASAACASAPVKTRNSEAPGFAAADLRLLEGCYDCLLEARDSYARAASGVFRPLVLTRLFEAELLIALREKELALDATASLERARAIGRELPATAEADRYLAILDALPSDALGNSRSESATFARAHAAFYPTIGEQLTWLATGALREPVNQYLALALECLAPEVSRRPTGPPSEARSAIGEDAAPLLRYRVAICRGTNQTPLRQIQALVPEFIETTLFLGRATSWLAESGGDGVEPRSFAAVAYARFPRSTAATYLAGTLERLVGNCGEALHFYDETIARRPLHEAALIGRTECLSELDRPEDAISQATRLIELSPYNIRDAYYWRSFNHNVLGAIALARADIESAKREGSTAAIRTLAGVIEYQQDDLMVAETDLKIAIALDSGGPGGGNCVAQAYLGLVFLKRQRWTEAGTNLERGMTCYNGRAQAADAKAEALTRTDLEAAFIARQVAAFQKSATQDRGQASTAALNASSAFAGGGDLTQARALLDLAAADSALSTDVATLRAYIDTRERNRALPP